MKITTTGPVKHDGKDVEIGTTLDLPPRQARDLIDAFAAEPFSKAKAEKDAAPAQETALTAPASDEQGDK